LNSGLAGSAIFWFPRDKNVSLVSMLSTQ